MNTVIAISVASTVILTMVIIFYRLVMRAMRDSRKITARLQAGKYQAIEFIVESKRGK